MLHLIFQSSFEHSLFQRFTVGDDLVFLENAVFSLLNTGRFNAELIQLQQYYQLYAMADALNLCAITSNELVATIKIINYDELVDLTVNNTLIHSWI